MDLDKIPGHLSMEEHLVHAAEQQLFHDGWKWLRRAADLYTQTPKIKIWVPVLGSLVMTAYSLYAIHAKTANAPQLSPPVARSLPVAVAVTDDTPLPKLPATTAAGLVANTTERDESDSELVKRARQAHADRQFADEAKLLQQVLDHSQAPQQVCPAIGIAYERAAAVDLSIKAFEKCTAASLGNVDMLVAFAHVLQAKPDFIRASTLYRQCLITDPGNLDAQSGLALVELRQNHLRRANEAAQAILQKSPDSTDALLIAGLVAWRQGRLDEAAKIFARGIVLDDYRADFHALMGRIAEAQRHPRDALREYALALNRDPDDTEVADRRDRLRETR